MRASAPPCHSATTTRSTSRSLRAFPFLGTTYASVWVNSDGNITFGAGDPLSTPRDFARHIGGPPRISALLADLNPSAGGAIHARSDASRLVVTWSGVPEYGVANANTFQATLHASGRVDLVYQRVDAQFGV